MRVWVDLTNSPHVLVMRPVIRVLEQRGAEVLVTARDFAQTLELCERFILDPVNEERWERLALALEADAFPLDTEAPAPGSLRFDVSRLLNQLETACAGVNSGFYARSVVASYLEDHAALLYEHFLRQDRPTRGRSRRSPQWPSRWIGGRSGERPARSGGRSGERPA